MTLGTFATGQARFVVYVASNSLFGTYATGQLRTPVAQAPYVRGDYNIVGMSKLA